MEMELVVSFSGLAQALSALWYPSDVSADASSICCLCRKIFHIRDIVSVAGRPRCELAAAWVLVVVSRAETMEPSDPLARKRVVRNWGLHNVRGLWKAAPVRQKSESLCTPASAELLLLINTG
jgi:hypothetical protein